MTRHFATLLSALLLIGCEEARPITPKADVVNSIGMQFRRIEPGEFLMGAPKWDTIAEADERPAHKVILTQPYYMGVFEVTQQQYEQVTGKQPSYWSPKGDGREEIGDLDTTQFPVEMVNWFEADRFCEMLSDLPAEKKAGRTYRLPTEAEWEYACRAGTTTRFTWGNEVDLSLANYLGSEWKRPRPVGSYPVNNFGLHDMHGNVLEWCSDWHRDDGYTTETETDPTGPEEPLHDVRVLRGGGWKFTPASSSFRDDILPHRRGNAHGIRVVMEVEEQPKTESP